MTSTIAAAASHQLPAFHLPQVPRVRPPRLLPGSISPNTLPQPPGPVPDGQVWVQGKWRNPTSNAALQHQNIISQRVRRALKHHNHGQSIFAYKHIKSHQVVYSLTRNMESGQIMPQLVFHGKKTVPAALRRDSWRPYFAVHFPETQAGARAGLKAYRELRQFALSRQLSPPEGYLVTTEADRQRAKAKLGDPTDVRERMIKGDIKFPVVGQKLPKKLRGEKLMNQGATSVADLAFTLKLAHDSLPHFDRVVKITTQERDARRRKELGQRRWTRVKQMRRAEEEQQKEIAERQALVDTTNYRMGQMPLDKKVADHLSIEYDGAVADSNRVINKADIEKSTEAVQDGSHNIQVLWADMRDGTYAEAWPEGVFHGELRPVVTSQVTRMQVRQPETIAEDGVKIEKQLASVHFVSGSSPHIVGREKYAGYKPFQDEIRETAERARAQELLEKPEADFQAVMRSCHRHIESFETLVADPEFHDLEQMDSEGEYLNPAERKRLADFQSRQRDLLSELEAVRAVERKYPDLASKNDLRDYWKFRLPSLDLLGQRQEELEAIKKQLQIRAEAMMQDEAVAAEAQSLTEKLRSVREEQPTNLSEEQLEASRVKYEQLEALKKRLEALQVKHEESKALLQTLEQDFEEFHTAIGLFEDQIEQYEERAQIWGELIAEKSRLQPGKERLLSVLDERKATIMNLRAQIAQQTGGTHTGDESSVLNAEAVNAASEASVDAVKPVGSSSADIDALTAELKDLQTAQKKDQAELRELGQTAFQTWVKDNPNLDVAALLPRSYRDDKYWPDSAEQSYEEVPNIEEIAEPEVEEKKGLVKRMREGASWWFSGGRRS